MAVAGLSPWDFSLGILMPSASRTKTLCNCCGIQDCCTLILLTVQQGKGKEKNHSGKISCVNGAVNWLFQNASAASCVLISGCAQIPKIRNECCPVQFSKAQIQRCQRGKKKFQSETLADFIRIKPRVFCGLPFSLFFLFI